jgi:DNA-binding Lrp family transcriptional regulator
MAQKQLFKVRDKRNRGWFWIENEYFNGFGKILGANAIAVYVCLCRHADNEQKCFPSQKEIAKELKLGERTVREIIRAFQKYKIIEIERTRTSKGKWLHNTYWLLDKTEWIYPEAGGACGYPEADNDIPRGNTLQTQRQVVPPKEDPVGRKTNKKEDPLLPTQSVGKEINDLIYLFKTINPSYEKFYKITTQRDALKRLFEKMGREKLEQCIKILPNINKMKYAPIITTPLQLEDKLGSLMVFINKEKLNHKSNVAII